MLKTEMLKIIAYQFILNLNIEIVLLRYIILSSLSQLVQKLTKPQKQKQTEKTYQNPGITYMGWVFF